MTVDLLTAPLGDGSPIAGTVERIGSRWVFGRTHTTTPLLPEVTVSKGFWDTFFEIHVTPDAPVTVRVAAPSMRSRALIWGAVAAVVGAAAAIAAFAALR